MQLFPEGASFDVGVMVGYDAGRIATSAFWMGRDARLRSGTVIYGGSRIGDRLETGHGVVIREETVIGDDVSIWSHSVVDYGCVIGDRVKIHCNCYIAQYTEISRDAFLAPGVTITNDLYPGQPGSAEPMQGPRILEGAQIGANATILPYVTIGAGAMIGAGSVVTKDIPDGMLAYGCPAVPVRRVDQLGDIEARIQRARSARARPLRPVARGED
jgi:acetyltransferase-like isoleucine patch superfamily enzyme